MFKTPLLVAAILVVLNFYQPEAEPFLPSQGSQRNSQWTSYAKVTIVPPHCKPSDLVHM